MPKTLAEITNEAFSLPTAEQLKLARVLLEHTQGEGEAGAEHAWEEEIERRIQLIDSGRANGRPFTEVLRNIDRSLGR